jgi:hypothetical protein
MLGCTSFMRPLCHSWPGYENRALVEILFPLVLLFSGPLDWDE